MGVLKIGTHLYRYRPCIPEETKAAQGSNIQTNEKNVSAWTPPQMCRSSHRLQQTKQRKHKEIAADGSQIYVE